MGTMGRQATPNDAHSYNTTVQNCKMCIGLCYKFTQPQVIPTTYRNYALLLLTGFF